jgi:hypothetical protein
MKVGSDVAIREAAL